MPRQAGGENTNVLIFTHVSKDTRALDFLFLCSLYANLKAKTIHLVSQMRGQGLSVGHQGQPRTQSFPECICRSGAFSALSP